MEQPLYVFNCDASQGLVQCLQISLRYHLNILQIILNISSSWFPLNFFQSSSKILSISTHKQLNEGKYVRLKSFPRIIGLTIDCFLGRVYWSDYEGKKIKSATFQGKNISTLVNTSKLYNLFLTLRALFSRFLKKTQLLILIQENLCICLFIYL